MFHNPHDFSLNVSLN